MTQQQDAAREPRGHRPMRSRGRGGAKLREERVAAGLEQKELAAAFFDGDGIPTYMLSGFEREECRLPRGFSADYRRAIERARR